MADPVTMMAISMGMTAAGGAVKAFGQLQEGEGSAAMYKYKAAVAQQNAAYEAAAGEVAAQRSGMKSRYELGQARAAQGASNLDVARGSAPLVRQSMHDVGLQEQGIIRSDYARRAYGQQEEAKLDVQAAKNVKKASQIAAVGSILGAATSVSDKWMAGKTAGIKIYGET